MELGELRAAGTSDFGGEITRFTKDPSKLQDSSLHGNAELNPKSAQVGLRAVAGTSSDAYSRSMALRERANGLRPHVVRGSFDGYLC